MGRARMENCWRPWIGALALALAFCLAGCQPMRTSMPPVPAPPPSLAPPPVQAPRPLLYVGVNRLNLRACPGMDCPKISVLERNEEVEKVGESEDWTQIRVKRDGRLGWVNSRYLSAEPTAAVPEGAPGPPAVVTPPPLPAPAPEKVQPPPLPAPPAAEKPKPAKPPEAAPAKPAKPAKPRKAEEEEEEAPSKPAPAKPPKEEKPAPAEKPAPEKPAPKQPEPAPEPGKRIRIM